MIYKIKKKVRNMQNMLDTIVHYANAEDEATGDDQEDPDHHPDEEHRGAGGRRPGGDRGRGRRAPT